ncbi:MAG: DUF4166 domain-containing protein [Caulobacteraceae bacterium]|nr:DUF4166 domain-containing protein [Caulobacteraceae bacterium]
MKVLIVGGYGTFGARLARLLARDGRLTLIIAGRSLKRAQALCDRLDGAAERIPCVLDRSADLSAFLMRERPQVVVDAAGPFQTYGDDPYRLARAALSAGADYLDLADAADFVAGVAELDPLAREKGRCALSGLSTFPALSSAVVAALATGLDRITAIRAGVAPSPRAGVGANVVRAIASYAGKPLPVLRGGERVQRPAIIDSLRRTIAAPGGLPLQNTLFTLAETPDLKLAPGWERTEDLQDLWTGAGPRPELLHRMLSGLAWLPRWRLLPDLIPLAEVLHWGSRTFTWGEHRGGMFVEVEGEGPAGPARRAWHLVAEGDDGPFIPSIGAAVVIRALADGRRPQPGARSAAGAVSLADYEAAFAQLHIRTGVWDAPAADWPLYRRALGPAWETLPEPVRRMHTVRGERLVRGRAEVERGGGLLSRLIGAIMGMPRAGADVPVEVRFTEADGIEVWRRTFADQSFSSRQSLGRGRSEGLVVERFGAIGIAMAVTVEDGRLNLHIRRATFLGVPLPGFLRPRLETFETVDARGRFVFDDRVSMPLAGLIVHYRGWLTPVEPEPD